MAAPNIDGSAWPGEPDDQEQRPTNGIRVDRASGLDEEARLRQIAELSERLTAIEARDRHRDTTTPVGTGTAATDERSHPTAAGWSTPTAGAIGSSGSGRTNRHRGQEPGGHPEDDKGDPEAVAKAVCLRLLAVSARPRAGLATALRQRGIPDDVADRVLNRFVEVGLIDDAAYAEAFVAAKHRERALGVSALRMELRRKGVADQTVDAAVSVLDQDAERQRAQALISRRVDAAMAHGAVAARRRLVALLARRGYSADLACQVVDKALADYGAEQADGWFD
jgi:regulatory protein